MVVRPSSSIPASGTATAIQIHPERCASGSDSAPRGGSEPPPTWPSAKGECRHSGSLRPSEGAMLRHTGGNEPASSMSSTSSCPRRSDTTRVQPTPSAVGPAASVASAGCAVKPTRWPSNPRGICQDDSRTPPGSTWRRSSMRTPRSSNHVVSSRPGRHLSTAGSRPPGPRVAPWSGFSRASRRTSATENPGPTSCCSTCTGSQNPGR